jgi:hypothetical protein
MEVHPAWLCEAIARGFSELYPEKIIRRRIMKQGIRKD